MNRIVLNFLLGIAAVSFLSACGGSSSSPGPSSAPSVSSITAASVVYRKSAAITVSGQNLDSGIAAFVIGCSNLAEQPGGSATSRSYSCVPVYSSSFDITISDAATGAPLKKATVPVPLPQVTLVTSKGTIVMELRPDKAKQTVDNFLQYLDDGFYDNTVFHRVVSGFVVQGGGYATGQTTLKATNEPILLEPTAVTGLSNLQGTLAMARLTAVNTATSQFFVNTVDNTNLDTLTGGYAVFGSVIQGMNVVKAIEAVAVDSGKWPTTPVILTSASRSEPLTVTTPAAPTGLTATGGTKQVTLNWDTDPAAAAYSVYATTGTTAVKTKVFPPVTLTALTANTTYSYTVTAVNSAGVSAPSAAVSATTLP